MSVLFFILSICNFVCFLACFKIYHGPSLRLNCNFRSWDNLGKLKKEINHVSSPAPKHLSSSKGTGKKKIEVGIR